MRRFDVHSGVEMWVGDMQTIDGWDWLVHRGFDAFGVPDEIASGTEKYQREAQALANEIYEYHVEQKS